MEPGHSLQGSNEIGKLIGNSFGFISLSLTCADVPPNLLICVNEPGAELGEVEAVEASLLYNLLFKYRLDKEKHIRS